MLLKFQILISNFLGNNAWNKKIIIYIFDYFYAQGIFC